MSDALFMEEKSVPTMPLKKQLWRSTVAWLFGAMWLNATSGAPLTLFANHLGLNNFQFGILSALPFVASLLTIPASAVTEHTGQRKLIFLICLYFQRSLWFVIATVPVLCVMRWGVQPWIVWMFLAMIFVSHASNAFGSPAWTSWMSDLVPKKVRGKYFARRRTYAMWTAAPTALFAGWLLDRYARHGEPIDTLWWCGGIFFVAAALGIVDIVFFHTLPEIPHRPQANVGLLKRLSTPLRDTNFLWFAGFIGSMTFALGFMGQFVTKYLIERIGVTNTGTQLMLLVVPNLAQLVFVPVWGHAIDRMGRKPVLAITTLALIPVGLGWCFMESGLVWLGYVLSVAGTVLWAGADLANFNMVMDLAGSSKEGKKSGMAYASVNSLIVSMSGLTAGLVAGWIAQRLTHWTHPLNWGGIAEITFYEVLFGLSAFFRLIAVVVFLPRIHEPTARPTREALRFVSAGIYNNLISAATFPFRIVRRRED